MSTPSTDTDELARFGYKQELDRSLGLFSSFAAGFVGVLGGLGAVYYLVVHRGRPATVLEEHRSGTTEIAAAGHQA
jgi:hypothetical protein